VAVSTCARIHFPNFVGVYWYCFKKKGGRIFEWLFI
jgi:hypothetical protein